MIRRIWIASILLLAIAASLEGQARVGMVSGRIQSQDGTPAAGIRVTAVAAGDVEAIQEGTLVSSALTDDTGRYRLEDIPPGRYFIAAGAIGTLTYLPGTTDASKATPISVSAGSQAENLNFKLLSASGVRIRGVVTGLPPNLSTKTLRAFRVILRGPALIGSDGSKESSLKEDGAFELHSVPPGNYSLQLLPGYQQIGITVADELRLTVADASIDGVTLKAQSVVTGRVVFEDGSPLPATPGLGLPGTTSVVIVIAPPDSKGYTNHPVTDDGMFAFTTTPGIAYTIQAYGLPFGSYVKSIRSGSADLLTGRLSTDANAENAENVRLREIDIVLTRQRPATEPEGITVRGRVIASNAQPLPGNLEVELTMNPQRYTHQIPVENDGSFTFRNVPAGNYTARVYTGGLPLLGLPPPTAVVVGGTNIDDLKLVAQAKVTLKVHVRIENGNASSALPSMYVRFTRADGRDFSVRAEGSTFPAILLEGTYKVAVTNFSARHTVQSIAYGSADASQPILLDPAKPLEDVVVTLRDRNSP